AGRARRLPHRRAVVLLPSVRCGLLTIHPTREEFRELARKYTVVPVWRERLACLIPPVGAVARLTRDDEPGFLLESVEHGERWSRWSFVGRRAAATLVSRDGRVEGTDGRLPDGIPTGH